MFAATIAIVLISASSHGDSVSTHYFTCTHSVFSYETNNVFCDFWYRTRDKNENDLKLCDCRINNGKY